MSHRNVREAETWFARTPPDDSPIVALADAVFPLLLAFLEMTYHPCEYMLALQVDDVHVALEPV